MKLVEVIDAYTRGEGWVWGERDCIGLLFHCVNYYAPTPQLRIDHIPTMGYEESVAWLAKTFSDPVLPYLAMMQAAGLKAPDAQADPQAAIVVGGRPLKAIGFDEWYVVDPVPGVVFQPSPGAQYAFMRSGLRPVSLSAQGRRIYRFGMKGG